MARLAPRAPARLVCGDLSTVYRWRRRARRGESRAEKPRSGRPPQLAATDYPRLRQLDLAHPDATVPAYAAYLAGATGVRLRPSHLSRVLARLGLQLKKRV